MTFSVRNIAIQQGGRRLWQDFSLELALGERLGISAPSGYGKTTLGKTLAGWQPCLQGEILWNATPLSHWRYYPVQLVPQHPERSFNPYRTTGQGLHDAWHPTIDQMRRLHINPDWLTRKPAQLSGGELARIALLRAFDPRTQVLIADEVTAQVDPPIQQDLWQQMIIESAHRPLAMIIFSHQVALLEQVCTRIIYPAKKHILAGEQ